MRFTRIKETCLYVSDLERTRGFYQDQLGMEVVSFIEGNHVFFRAGESMLLCFLPEKSRNKTDLPPHFGHGNLHFALEVPEEEYEAWKERIRELNIPIEKVQQWQQGSRESFYFRDPDHHSVEIVQPGIWGKGR